uniref:Uncharacterized protein n=1 Tax=Lotharella globosa TaxID=91324 RepID=A0A6V3JTN6_9EUKA|mmetsp:Transcript_4612/g.8277  ORF Transcript_4612/g.8277 Transcript_4612/m.8277 type:complete len:409 (+) Transcript_4612:65-1291(+)|eukprot:CAMPEP_0167771970 /NCGR_PEP_ID=MMETSP0111_2-20121227/581_1 /TAXON_ID=91324 /ORGANISM="Lotharella globosa, Strain CCCM811" /LENGTH=408 /DNA_ID=CAMNT_0007661397 /DNA_START=210 /DNA_END=1436 /DNA_ORIENTATION=-
MTTSKIDWQGLGGFGAVFKGGVLPPGAPAVIPPGHPLLLQQRGQPDGGIMFEDFERKAFDPVAAWNNFCRKNRAKVVQFLKDANQEAGQAQINAKLQELWKATTEEEKKSYQSNKRVRTQKGAVFGSEKFEQNKLKQESSAIISSIDKLYSMGVAVTMAMAARNGKTYKYFPEEMANEREVMKSLDQHLLQLQYSLWDEKDLGPMTLRASDAKESRSPDAKVTSKKSLAQIIRPRLEAILGGTIAWKKLQTGTTKLLGWPLKDKEGKDRFPNRFFDLKISEMKSILNVIDGITMIDHDREGRHVVSIVQTHINRIIQTYSEKHKDNKDLQAYVLRLKAALSVASGERMPPMPAQPMPAQPMQAQPMPTQPTLQAQPMQAQPMPTQPTLQAQPMQAQPMPPQPPMPGSL